MKKILLTLIIALTAAGLASAESGKVSYLEGDVRIKNKAGQTRTADIGSAVVTGDTVITGKDGFCEITLDNGSTIKVSSGTVFAITEREDVAVKGKKRSVFSTILGVVTCKFKKFSGDEPYIATPTTACGVRGTEFTIVAGADGSAMYVLEEGAIAVSAQGQEVALAPEEGVKVQARQKPERKFEAKIGTVDFNKVSAEAEAAMRANPTGSLDNLWAQMKDYEKESDSWKSRQLATMAQADKLREEVKAKRDSMAEKEWKDLYGQTVAPLESDISLMDLNSRYYVVSSLAVRKYLISSIYVYMRARYIQEQDAPEWLAFKKKYDSFMQYYNDEFISTGYILERDI